MVCHGRHCENCSNSIPYGFKDIKRPLANGFFSDWILYKYIHAYIHFKAIIATSVYLQKISTTNIYFSHLFISISSRCINK